jgi:thioredoxin reductase (NADPH)
MDMKNQAVKYGLQLKRAEVSRIQSLSGNMYVACVDGTTYTAKTIIVTAGSIHRKLGVPGEEEFRGSGVISCAFCDGGEFADQVVAVFGGGDAGITEALYLTRIAAKVYLIEALPELTGTAILRDRVKNEPKIEVLCGKKAAAILGSSHVEAVQLLDVNNNTPETIKADGVLVHIGLDPNSGFLEGVVQMDNTRQVKVNERMETNIPGIFAAGDIRSGSPRQVAGAVGDGAIAGIFATRYLQQSM